MTEEKLNATIDDQKPLDKMTVKDLRELAKDIPEITGASAMKKDELLAKIKEVKGIVNVAPQVKAPKTVKKKGVSSGKKAAINSPKECKKLIAEFRKQKDEAKTEGDKNTANILRKKINRLKKKSRKFKKVV
jgi:hypothetical protein